MKNMPKLQALAIQYALQQDWKEAIKLNKEILKINSSDVDALLRIGYAYMQLEEYDNAKKIYQKILKMQTSNQIALHQIDKIEILRTKKISKKNKNIDSLHASQFLKIPGKTLVTSLVNLGQSHILAKLSHGEKAIIKIRKRKVEIRTIDGEYIGALPDDISRRLILFINAQSKYSVYLQNVHKQNIEVFIKEEEKGKKVCRFISFPKDVSQDIKQLESDEETNPEETDLDESEESINIKGEEPIDIEQLAQQLEEEKDTLVHSSNLGNQDDEDFEE